MCSFGLVKMGTLVVGIHLLLCGLSFCAADAEYQTNLCILCVFFSDFYVSQPEIECSLERLFNTANNGCPSFLFSY